MSIYNLLAFALVYALAVASPGPGVAAVIARSLGHGLRGAPAFIGGFVVGDLAWFIVAATGLAALAKTAVVLFLALKYAGAAYLVFLAYRLWTAPAKPLTDSPSDAAGRSRALFLGSLALTLGNPKTIVFFLALLPTVVDLEALSFSGFLEIGAVIAVVLPAVLGTYAVAAARARQILKSPSAVRALNRTSGATMAGAAAVIIKTA